MTKRQRVLGSIRRTGFDALPWQFDLTSVVIDKLAGYLKTCDVPAALDDHFQPVWLPSADPVYTEPVPAGAVRDAFGAVWRRDAVDRNIGDWGGLIGHPLDGPNLAGYRFPDPLSHPERMQAVAEGCRRHPDHFRWTGGSGLFERAWALCGFEDYLGFVAGEEAFVAELTEKLAEYSCREISLLPGLGLDAIRFGDDWGFQHGLMIQPEAWRRIYKEPYRRLFAAAHEAGLIAMMHSCGHVEPIIPDLIEVGLDVLHPLQPESNDVTKCQREYGKDITFWGALGSQSTLPHGKPEDVRREVRDRLRLFKDGGYILAPAGAAPTETPAENIAAIAQEARTQLRGS
jgi:uroporphyrinogen decarboxylase